MLRQILRHSVWRRKRPRPDVSTRLSSLSFRHLATAAATTDASPYASSSMTPKLRELERFTNLMLHVKKTPLGTLSAAQWDDTLLAMMYWLGTDNESADEQHPHLNGKMVENVNRLWLRLMGEHATQSVAARDRGDDLQQWGRTVLAAWLQLAQDHPESPLAVHKASTIWERLWKRQQQNLTDSEDVLSLVAELPNLVEAWLRLQTPVGSHKASEMLLANEELLVELSEERERIISMYHEALEQSMEFAVEDEQQGVESSGELTTDLLERMEALAQLPGWQDVKPDPQAVSATRMDRILMNSGAEDSSQKLSPFETEALRRRMVQIVQEATEQDADRVNEIQEQWNSLQAPSSTEVAVDFAQALTEYYIRIKAIQEATSWLQKLFPTNNEDLVADETKVALFDTVIRLWLESNETQAPWKAEELVKRLEILATTTATEGDVSVDASLYTLVAKRLLESGDARAIKRAQELMAHAQVLDASLWRILADTLPMDPNLRAASGDSLAQASALLQKKWNKTPEEERLQVTESLVQLLSQEKLESEVLELVHFVIQQGTVPTSTICENAARTFTDSSNPDDIISLVDALGECGADVTFECYQSAIQSLVDIRGRHRMEQLQSLCKRALNASITFQAEPEQIGHVLENVVRNVCYVKREQDALEILELAEAKLMAMDRGPVAVSPIPLICFKLVVKILLAARNHESARQVFYRTLGYYRAGYEDLVPDADFFQLYLIGLDRLGPSTITEQADLLQELIDLYKSTGKEEYKPKGPMLVGILQAAMVKNSSSEHKRNWANRTLELLNQMIDIKVNFAAKSFIFDMVMYFQAAWRPRKSFDFGIIKDIRKDMKTLGVPANGHTLRAVLLACRETNKNPRATLATLLETIEDVRRQGPLDVRRYRDLVNTLLLLFPRQDPTLDQVASVVFKIVCEDGGLCRDIREDLKSMLTPTSWNKLYRRNLLDGDQEPAQWSRNAHRSE